MFLQNFCLFFLILSFIYIDFISLINLHLNQSILILNIKIYFVLIYSPPARGNKIISNKYNNRNKKI
jgi:hypothetical protein